MSSDQLKKATGKSFIQSHENRGGPGAHLYLMIENQHKGNNLGPILRCAAAFAIRTVVTIGYSQCNTEGSHGAAKHVNIVAFPTVDQAVAFLRTECNCGSVIGLLGGLPFSDQRKGSTVGEDLESGLVQILQDHEGTTDAKYPCSTEVGRTKPFSNGNCCLVLSRSWVGLPVSLANHCDLFVHISYARVVTCVEYKDETPVELLDRQTCLAIALHHFSASATPQERTFEKHKFEKGIPAHFDKHSKLKERQEAKEKLVEDAEACFSGTLDGMFALTDDADY